ncbi:MAG: tRNA 2-thiouridine(34) synthase MnmA [Dehalococcoidia bacterium]|nr:tRNA 2-thiouridine(34) synthase MnmA [Dehalococcoidia bacterium]
MGNCVAVAMSGGVDSSVAAALLKEKGYQVIGVTMKTWAGEAIHGERAHHGCYGPGEEADIEDAREVARILGIPFYIFDIRREYKAEVVDYFCQEYLSGKTPNPCVRCNRKVKFGALIKKVESSGIEFDHFATGHYARVEYNRSRHRYLLKKAKDIMKDQTYFLFSLSQGQLGRCLFPLGNYTKEEVRRIASDFGLGVDNKPESQNFIAGGYSHLLGAAPPGPILNKHGKVLGEHRGIPFYTIGQRKGLGISAGEPLYVTGIDRKKNAIVVGTKEEVYGDELIASELNWIAMEGLRQPIEVKAKIRYLHKEAEAVITPLDEGKVYVKFGEPQMAIAPGQAVVFYQGGEVLGGGVIESAMQDSPAANLY